MSHRWSSLLTVAVVSSSSMSYCYSLFRNRHCCTVVRCFVTITWGFSPFPLQHCFPVSVKVVHMWLPGPFWKTILTTIAIAIASANIGMTRYASLVARVILENNFNYHRHCLDVDYRDSLQLQFCMWLPCFTLQKTKPTDGSPDNIPSSRSTWQSKIVSTNNMSTVFNKLASSKLR